MGSMPADHKASLLTPNLNQKPAVAQTWSAQLRSYGQGYEVKVNTCWSQFMATIEQSNETIEMNMI